jgi:hypothetical protein
MSDIAAWSADGEWWSTVDHWAIAIVFVGVVVEGIAEWLPKDRRDGRFWTALTRTGWLVLVLALAVEYVAQRYKDADDALIIASLNEQAETARAETARTNADVLAERRLTARERWRLERIERAVLPRSLYVNWNQLAAALKEGHFGPVNIAVVGGPEAENFGFALMLALSAADVPFKSIDPLHENPPKHLGWSSSGVTVLVANPDGDRLAQMLWQKFQIGGGSQSIGVAAHEWTALPTDANCLLVQDNGWALAPPSGQPGEGLDQHGRPVPAPQ